MKEDRITNLLNDLLPKIENLYISIEKSLSFDKIIPRIKKLERERDELQDTIVELDSR